MHPPRLGDAERPTTGPGGPRAGRRARSTALRASAWRRLVAGLLLAWTAALLARESVAALQGWRGRRTYRTRPELWRFGTPQTDRLARCLALVDATAEPGSRIRMSTAGADFFRERWAAYLLPAHHLLPEGTSSPDVDLVVAFSGNTPPGARVLGGGPRCRLLRPPSSSSPAPAQRR